MISIAYAQAAPAAGQAQGGGYIQIIMMVAVFGIFYFLMIRPQQKKAKEQQATINATKVGDEVLITSGIVGKIRAINDNYVDLEIAKDTVIKIQKNAIVQVFPKGSFD